MSKGEEVTIAEGHGEVIEMIKDKIVVQLDSGSLVTVPMVHVESEQLN